MAKRRCTKCRDLKIWPEEFATSSTPKRGKYVLGHCIECERERRREYGRRTRERRREYEREWRCNNPDKARAHDRRYNASPKGRARLKRYNESEKGRAAQLRYKKSAKGREAARLWYRQNKEKIANFGVYLPAPVVQPYIELLRIEALRYIGLKKGAFPGLTVVSEWTGVDESLMARIMKGERKSVGLEIADRLSLRADFTLEEIYDEAAAWAERTGDPWPDGYRRG